MYTVEPVCCSCVKGKGKSQALISLSGLQCCALIDTGAQISLLREDIYQGLQQQGIVPLEIMEKATLVRGLGAATTTILGIVKVPVTFAG